jgi:CO dehydrogenase maturation factor
MSKELDIRIEKSYLLINRVNGELPPETGAFVEKLGIPLLGTISTDAELSTFDATGKPLVDLPDASPVYQSVVRMLQKILG